MPESGRRVNQRNRPPKTLDETTPTFISKSPSNRCQLRVSSASSPKVYLRPTEGGVQRRPHSGGNWTMPEGDRRVNLCHRPPKTLHETTATAASNCPSSRCRTGLCCASSPKVYSDSAEGGVQTNPRSGSDWTMSEAESEYTDCQPNAKTNVKRQSNVESTANLDVDHPQPAHATPLRHPTSSPD